MQSVRVFPFAFPPIMGGAQGGASPTPTPPQYPDVYDLDDAALSYTVNVIEDGDWKTVSGDTFIAAGMALTGISPKDLSGAASVKIEYGWTSLTADGVEMITDDAVKDAYKTNWYTGLQMAVDHFGPSGMRPGWMAKDDWNDKMAGKAAGGTLSLTLTVYDADGNVLQTETWSVDI